MERDKPVYKQPALSQLLNRLRVGKYPQRPPPAPPPRVYPGSSHETEHNEARGLTLRFQQFGEVLLEEYNVVQLFPDENFNQIPTGW